VRRGERAGSTTHPDRVGEFETLGERHRKCTVERVPCAGGVDGVDGIGVDVLHLCVGPMDRRTRGSECDDDRANAGGVQRVDAQADDVEQRTGVRLRVGRVAVRNLSAPRDVELPEGVLTRDTHGVVSDPDVDIVVEAIGGIEPARELIVEALANGKSVVTANKELLANVGAELYASADAAQRDLLFEAAVAGGIPIMRALRESLHGEPIDRVLGIINGTTNYIPTMHVLRPACTSYPWRHN